MASLREGLHKVLSSQKRAAPSLRNLTLFAGYSYGTCPQAIGKCAIKLSSELADLIVESNLGHKLCHGSADGLFQHRLGTDSQAFSDRHSTCRAQRS